MSSRVPYTHPDDPGSWTSVTTIIGSVWPSHHLDRWKVGNQARRCVNDSTEIRDLLKRSAKLDEDMRDGYVKKISDLLWEWRDDWTAADRGTRIHTGVERLLNGEKRKSVKKDMVDSEFQTAVHAVDALGRLKIEPEYIEARVFNFDSRYAGTVDLIG